MNLRPLWGRVHGRKQELLGKVSVSLSGAEHSHTLNTPAYQPGLSALGKDGRMLPGESRPISLGLALPVGSLVSNPRHSHLCASSLHRYK